MTDPGMKVVLFAGGQGLRMREVSERLPKPMVPIGGKPILLHLMRYYAHFGHRRFVICLGYKGEVIEQWFSGPGGCRRVRTEEDGSRTVVSESGGWTMTFVDTGISAKVGERLMAVRQHLAGEDHFLANYGDVLTDAHLPDVIDRVRSRGATAGFLCVHPTASFHTVSWTEDGVVEGLHDISGSDVWINGGFFVMRHDMFDYMEPGEDLVEQPFARLIAEGRLLAHRHEGFWAPMDGLKDKQTLEAMHEAGVSPWRVWAHRSAA